MLHVKVLGTGCANCKNTIALVQAVAGEKGVAVEVEKVEELRDIMAYGILSTPGVVIDGRVVHAGGVPSRRKRTGGRFHSSVDLAKLRPPNSLSSAPGNAWYSR